MIRHTLAAIIAASTLSLSAGAQTTDEPSPVSSGLADEQVDVQINYSSAEVVLFVSSPVTNETGGMAAALIGPRRPHTITRQTEAGPRSFTFMSAPSVFVIGAEPQVAETTEAQALIDAGLNAATAAVPNEEDLDAPDLATWRAALVELKMDQDLYSLDEGIVERVDDNLLRARMVLPPNAPPGDYLVRAVVFENGVPIGSTEKVLNLVRTGMEATLYDLATNHGVVYGFLAVLIGVIIGSIAAWAGRR